MRVLLGALVVGYSKLELLRLTRHRMISASSVRLLGWDDALLLLIHLHPHQRLLKTHNHLAGPKSHLQGLVVAGRVVEPRALRFLLHRRVEDLSTRKPSKIVNRDRVSFLRLQVTLAHDESSNHVLYRS